MMPPNIFQFTTLPSASPVTVHQFRVPELSSPSGDAPRVIPPSDANAPSRLYGTRTRASSIVDEQTLFSNRADLKVRISQVAMHLSDSQRTDLFRQIDELLNMDDWTEDDHIISLPSFRTFLRFLIYYGRVRRPALTVTNDSNIAASWFAEKHRLTIEFLVGDRIRVVMFRVLQDDQEAEPAVYQGPLNRIGEVVASFDGTGWYQE